MEDRKDDCFILLLDSDEDDYTLAKSMFQEAFGDHVKLEWFPRDGFSNEMICSGVYAFTMVEYQIGGENGLEIIRKAVEQCPDQIIFLFSDWMNVDLENRASQVGAKGYFNKNDMSVSAIKSLFSPYLCVTSE